MFISKGYKGYYDLYYLNPSTGKRTKISTGKKTKKEADNFFRDFIRNESKVIMQPNKNFNFSNLNKEILEFVEVNFSSKTYIVYKNVTKNLFRILGDKEINLYTHKDFENYKNIRVREINRTSVNIEIRTLKAIFNFAIRMRYLEENPLQFIKQFSIPQKEILSFSDSDICNVLEIIKNKYFRNIIIFALLTGCRINEILNIQIKDIDFIDLILTINNKFDFKVKTGKIRYIPISNKLEELIKSILIYQVIASEDLNPERYLFSNLNGQKLNSNYVSKKFKKYLRKAGLPEKYHFHCLRHTFITNLIRNGVNINFVKQLAGHSDIKTTMGYVHLETEDLRDAMNQFKLVI